MDLTKNGRKNAIIMAAGASSRFVPHCFEYPKALLKFRGEVLIERQIGQLIEAGAASIAVVTGYKKEQFAYLAAIPQVKLIENPDYTVRNNHSTLYYAQDYLEDCFVCCGDHYYVENPFAEDHMRSSYAAVYASGDTDEWCLNTRPDGLITDIQVGGRDAWVMMGYAYFTQAFGQTMRELLNRKYHEPDIINKFWEDIYLEHQAELPLYIKKMKVDSIYEFDSFDELLAIDPSFAQDPQSQILTALAHELNGTPAEIRQLKPIKKGTVAMGFRFAFRDGRYRFHLAADGRGGVCMLEPDGSSGGECFEVRWNGDGI